jgi:hypothetical protein
MIRDEMRDACDREIVAFEPTCQGRVKLTQAHLSDAKGETSAELRQDILAEARIGCCQKCGCLEATAWFEKRGDIEYVVAQCAEDPSAAFLGHRVEPDPGRAK